MYIVAFACTIHQVVYLDSCADSPIRWWMRLPLLSERMSAISIIPFSSHYLSTSKLSPSWECWPSQSFPSPTSTISALALSKLRPAWLKCLPSRSRYPIICKHTTVSQNMTVKTILSGLYWPHVVLDAMQCCNQDVKKYFYLQHWNLWSLALWHCSPLSDYCCLFILQCPAHLILTCVGIGHQCCCCSRYRLAV